MRYLATLCASLAALLMCAPAAGARPVEIPLRFDLDLVRQALLAQLYSEPGEKAVILDDNQSCQWFYLFEPSLDVSGSRLRMVSRADVGRGVMVKQKCIGASPWEGFVEVFDQLEMDNASSVLTLRTTDWNLYDKARTKKISSGFVWNMIKKPLLHRIGEVRIDFSPVVQELQSWLPLVLRGEPQAARGAVTSLTISRPVLATDAITLTLSFAPGGRAPVTAAASEPALSPQELAALGQHLQQWDAFITFVVKELARPAPEAAQRQLMGVLLEARYELADILGREPGSTTDSVQSLFVRTWERLAPLARAMASRQAGPAVLQYLSFISAADALTALQAASPLGVDLSTDGLRRLARMLQPSPAADPLTYSLEVDQDLRALMGFGPPLASPAAGQNLTGHAAWPLHPLCNAIFFIRQAQAAEAKATIDYQSFRPLHRWVPQPDELGSYLAMVRDLLQQTSDRALGAGALPDEYSSIYRSIVLATAWQESCWRQFIKSGNAIVPLTSAAGSVGLMQINQHVWRGLYNLQGIHNNIAYNAAAGCEIVLHYLRDYALAQGEHLQPGGAANLARATYAAYNGGPGHLTRYRRASQNAALQAIDRLFWEKYQTVQAGRVMEVATCYE